MSAGLLLAGEDLGGLVLGWSFFTSLPVMIGVAFVAGRLLGVRRSWTAAVASGVIGWLAGAALSLTIAEAEGTDAGFSRNIWLFSAFFAMSTTAWVELLAKPGALARAQTGLASIPRPVRAVRRKRQRLARYVQITRIAAKYGLGRSLGMGGAGDETSAARPPPARRLRAALEECGGMFVKLGQVLSTRSDLLPPEAAEELSRLQDNVAPAGRAEVEPVLVDALGRSVDDVFAEFDWMPLAAASIGQAYRARLHDGEKVIVKVQRPGVAEIVDRDLQVLGEITRSIESRTAWAADYNVSELTEEFAERLREELDFRVEARNANEIAGRLDASSLIRIPGVREDVSSARVLVMEWLDGVSVRDSERVDAAGVDRAGLADALLRCFLQQMLIDGHFHADPHPGNVMVLRDGRVGLIDFGAAGRLDPMQQSSLRAMMLAVNRRDPMLLRQAVLEVAVVRRGFDDEQLERALARFMARHLGSGATPSAAMFNELLQLFFSFGLSLPPEFSTFFRAMITLEGTLTTLCPGFLVIDAAQSVAAEWARDQMRPGTIQELARQELLGMAPLLRRLPRHIDRMATMAERDGLKTRLSLFSEADDVRVVTRLVNRVVMAFLGGVVGVISVLLLGIDGGPPFTGETSLYEFFGYFGLFCSTVLTLRVLVAIIRDGLN